MNLAIAVFESNCSALYVMFEYALLLSTVMFEKHK